MTIIPNIISLAFSFIFGVVIGSFLNVVTLRLNTGRGVNGRSACMSCNNQLTWKELIPVVSFVAQFGKCKKCKSKISWQYPIIEVFAGIIFVFLFLTFPPVSFVATLLTIVHILAGCILLIISAYDSKHKIIPDSLAFIFGLLGLISLFVGGTSFWHIPTIVDLLAGPLLALPFALLWLVSKGKWMGLGDAKLAIGIGWFLGLGGGINAIVLAFWIAAAVSVIWLLFTYGKLKPRTEIPFGPYMIIGMYLVLLFGIEVINIDVLNFLFSYVV